MGKVAKRRRIEKMRAGAERRRRASKLSEPLWGGSTPASHGSNLKRADSIENTTKGSSKLPIQYRIDPTRNIPSASLETLKGAHEAPVKYEGEMLERELAAQEEIERKKKRIAPAYNKGAYQYITDGTDPSDLGRKK